MTEVQRPYGHFMHDTRSYDTYFVGLAAGRLTFSLFKTIAPGLVGCLLTGTASKGQTETTD